MTGAEGDEPEAVSDPNAVTILRTRYPMVVAKRFDVSTAGPITLTNFGNARHFSVGQATPQNIHDLHECLRQLEPQPSACIIRGEPAADTNRAKTPKVLAKNGGNFADVPRHWLQLDLDKIPAPPGFDILAEPQDAARRLLDMLVGYVPELEGVSAVVQHSSSAGLADLAEAEQVAGLPDRWRGIVKPGSAATVSAHVWFWLTKAQDGVALTRWAKAINAATGFKLIDPMMYGAVHAHFTAAPIFGAKLVDHLANRRTWLIEGEAEAATLTIPEVAPRTAWTPGQQAFTSRTYEGWLDAIGGPDGFQQPIMRAVLAFVGTNFPAPELDALVAEVGARVLAADPGGRGPSDIARYASHRFIADKANWAMAREAASRAEKAAEAAARAAAPIPPAYPDRGVPLAKAQALLGTTMRSFGTRIGEGEAPQLLINITVGGSKTYSAIVSLPLLIDIGRALGLGPILFTHPQHKLGDQIAADIRHQHPGIRVAIWRGMDAADPTNPGNAMCTVPELPADLSPKSQRLACVAQGGPGLAALNRPGFVGGPNC